MECDKHGATDKLRRHGCWDCHTAAESRSLGSGRWGRRRRRMELKLDAGRGLYRASQGLRITIMAGLQRLDGRSCRLPIDVGQVGNQRDSIQMERIGLDKGGDEGLKHPVPCNGIRNETCASELWRRCRCGVVGMKLKVLAGMYCTSMWLHAQNSCSPSDMAIQNATSATHHWNDPINSDWHAPFIIQ